MLFDMGFLTATVDGKFGKNTVTALNAYYAYTGWDEKGYATPLDISRMEAFYKESTGKTAPKQGLETMLDEASCLPDGTYCYTHRTLGNRWNSFLHKAPSTPEKLAVSLLTALQKDWLTAINTLYSEWAVFDSKTAAEQKKLFQQSWKNKQQEASALTPKSEGLAMQVQWLSDQAVDLCYDLHGKSN